MVNTVIKDRVMETYGDDIPTEQIAHTKHVKALTPEGLSGACMKDVDPDFHKKLENGKIMLAGDNFGCNSSREWAPAALLYSGVRLIIAKSFARIFFRNAINIGLPILECGDIRKFAKKGDELEANLTNGTLRNLTQNTETKATVLPDFLLNIMASGGLMEILAKEKAGR
jgi:3-isopropylmalate/(R)-2-methylmalate dehydratase small subunit